jgi:hypothetical protein
MASILWMSDLALRDIIRLFDGFTLLSRIPMPILVRSEFRGTIDPPVEDVEIESVYA